MKRIDEIKAFHIISEPGDATRYDYICALQGDAFRFVHAEGIIKYPDELSFWAVEGLYIEDLRSEKDELKIERIKSLAEEKGCNPFTIVECIRTIYELTERKEQNSGQ